MMKKTIVILAALISLQAAAQEVRLTLEECRQMALSQSSRAVNARLDIQAAQLLRQEALAEYFPRISVMSLGFHSLDPMIKIGLKDLLGNNDLSNNLQTLVDSYATMYGFSPYYSALQSAYGASVSVMQPIYAGGRIVTGNRLAALGVEAATLKQKVQERKSREETDELFWQVISLEEKQRTLDGFVQLLDTLCKDAGAAYGAGLMTENDLLQARLKRNELRTAGVKIRNGIRLSRMNLFNAIGQDYCIVQGAASADKPYIDSIMLDGQEGELPPPENFYIDEEKVAASMEEVRLLELNVESKRLEKRMAMGSTLPQLAVGATYGYSRTIGEGNFNGAAFATLQIPLSDWWKTSRKLRRLQLEVDKSESDRALMDKQILLLVRKSWLDLGAAWEEYCLSAESVQMAGNSLKSSRSHFDAGLVPMSELLQAQATLQQALDAQTDARTSYLKALRTWQDISYLCSSEN